MESHSLAQEILLSTLSGEETRELLSLRLGCLANSITEELVESIDSLCQGNPFFISETIREWYSRGMVVRTTDGWQRVHQTLDEESSLPNTVRSALRTRISDLSESAQLLVPAAAALGRIVDLDLLSDIVPEVEASEFLDAIDELLSKRIFKETSAASRVAFTHDLLRETIQGDLSSNRWRALHRKIAGILEAHKAESNKKIPPALLAYHYLEGEMTEQAFHYLLDAAEVAARAYSFDDALEHLGRAQANLPLEVSKADQFRLYSLLADAAGHTSQLPLAMDYARKALDFASTPLEQGRMLLLLGTYVCFQGDQKGSQVWFDEALKALGMPRAKSRTMQLLSIQCSLFGFHFLPRTILAWLNRSSSRGELHKLASEILYAYSYSIATCDVITYTDICATNARLARTSDSNAAKAVAYAKYGVNLAFSGANARLNLLFKRFITLSVRYTKLGVAFAQQDVRPEVLASVQTSLGFCHYCAGELHEAEIVLLESEKTLRRCRDLHTSYCYHFLRHVYSVMGVPSRIIEAGLNELEVSKSSADTELMGWSYYGLTHGYALAGNSEQALQAADMCLEYLQGNDSNFCSVGFLEKGTALVQASRYSEAIEAFQQSHDWMKKRWFYFEIVMPVFPRMVEALLGSQWHTSNRLKGIDIRSARRFARRGKFFSLSFPNIRPHVWRSVGRLQFAVGKTNRARKCFERSIAEAEKLGARYDLARALYDSGVAFPDLASRKQQALELLQEIGAVMPDAELESTEK